MMEDINEKAQMDELNKAEDSIEETPRKFIPVRQNAEEPEKRKEDEK